MSFSYRTTFNIFKKHPLGYVAIVLWILASIIDVWDMLVSFASGDIIAGLLDILVVVALVCYILTPPLSKRINNENPVQTARILFVGFASITVVFDILYAVVALSKGYRLTGYYWFTLVMDILLTIFTILGVMTTLKNVENFEQFEVKNRNQYTTYQNTQQSNTSINSNSEIKHSTNETSSSPKKFCQNCGAKIKYEARFCTECGFKTQ